MEEKIVVTGNTVVDALLFFSKTHPRDINKIIAQPLNNRRLILITTHRREALGSEHRNIAQAISELAHKYPTDLFVLPMHKNPKVRDVIKPILENIENVLLIEPLGYLDFVTVLKHSYLVLTDSGGVQEEAPTFGVPVLVLRTVTERTEAIDAGFAKLVGTRKADIVEQASLVLQNHDIHSKILSATNPFGDGKAVERIAQTLLRWQKGEKLSSGAECFEK